MNSVPLVFRVPLAAFLAATAAFFAGCTSMPTAQQMRLVLGGTQEVPPINTSASANGSIVVSPDRTVGGSVTTNGIAGTAAHIHIGSAGKNGPVIIPLVKSGDNVWSVPSGTKLTEAQYESFRAGDLYVNVHSSAHPGGEIRAQLTPSSTLSMQPSMGGGGY